jgi:alpha-L-rhamnosidase
MKKLVLFFLMAIANSSFAQVVVKNLLTENLANPIGLDEKLPRFSWQLSSDKRNTLQNAYEIKVSAGKTIVWNSGKIGSAQSVHVLYAGTALQSGKKYSWQVRVWDNNNNDKPSAWSETASFQMALLDASEWKAKWIELGFTISVSNSTVIKKLQVQLLISHQEACMKRRSMERG